MKTLHKFILKSYIGPLILIFFIVIFLLVMQFLWKYIDDLAGKGLEWYVIAELLLYASASLVTMALPLAVLMASLMTFGNMGENYELTALKASGISLRRIMSPLIYFSLVTSLLAFFFANWVMPYSNLKMQSLLYDVKRHKPALQIKEGIFYDEIDDYSIKVEEKDRKTDLLKNIMIYDHTDRSANAKVIVADSGYMKMTANEQHLMVRLFHGYNYTELEPEKRSREATYPHRRDHFEEQTFFISLSGFNLERTEESLFKDHYQMLNLDQLEAKKDSLQKVKNKRRERYQEHLIRASYHRIDEEFKNRSKHKNQVDTSRFIVDSLYNKLPVRERHIAITQALSSARSVRSHINTSEREIHNRNRLIWRHEIEWHRKFSLSFACLIFFFIGAPLGAIIRKGGLGMPVVISVLFFVFYYIITMMGEKFVREGIWDAIPGMWFSSFILLPMGIFLTFKATHDSVILNLETYAKFFKRIEKLLGIK